jgi:hypothetical protein
MKFTILITTYERPDMPRQLIDDICMSKQEHELSLFIADEGSKQRYLGDSRAEYPKVNICGSDHSGPRRRIGTDPQFSV